MDSLPGLEILNWKLKTKGEIPIKGANIQGNILGNCAPSQDGILCYTYHLRFHFSVFFFVLWQTKDVVCFYFVCHHRHPRHLLNHFQLYHSEYYSPHFLVSTWRQKEQEFQYTTVCSPGGLVLNVCAYKQYRGTFHNRFSKQRTVSTAVQVRFVLL